MSSTSKIAAFLLIIVILGAAAYYLGLLPPEIKKIIDEKLGQTPTVQEEQTTQTVRTETTSTTQTQLTTTSASETPVETPTETREETPGTLNETKTEAKTAKLPPLATNLTLDKLEEILEEKHNETVRENTPAYTPIDFCSSGACQILVDYYEKVKKEDLNLLDLFDTTLLDNTSLIDLHKALYESFDLLSYNITWLFNSNEPPTANKCVPGFDKVYIVPYNFTAVYKDQEGQLVNITTQLVGFIGMSYTEDGKEVYKILQILPLNLTSLQLQMVED